MACDGVSVVGFENLAYALSATREGGLEVAHHQCPELVEGVVGEEEVQCVLLDGRA